MINGVVKINGETFTDVYEVTIKSRKEEKNGDHQTMTAIKDFASPLTINITCNVETLNTETGDVIVTGNANQVKTNCDNIKVKGAITSGNATTTNGDVKVGGKVHGNASTMNGSVKCNGCKRCNKGVATKK